MTGPIQRHPQHHRPDPRDQPSPGNIRSGSPTALRSVRACRPANTPPSPLPGSPAQPVAENPAAPSKQSSSPSHLSYVLLVVLFALWDHGLAFRLTGLANTPHWLPSPASFCRTFKTLPRSFGRILCRRRRCAQVAKVEYRNLASTANFAPLNSLLSNSSSKFADRAAGVFTPPNPSVFNNAASLPTVVFVTALRYDVYEPLEQMFPALTLTVRVLRCLPRLAESHFIRPTDQTNLE